MKVNANSLAVAKVVTKDKGDASLYQVRIDPDGTAIASDGEAVVAIEPEGWDGSAREGFGIPPVVLRTIMIRLRKNAELVYLGEKNGLAEFSARDVMGSVEEKADAVRLPFPVRWAKVFEGKNAGGSEVIVKASSLKNALDAILVGCSSATDVVMVRVCDDGVVVRGVSSRTKQNGVAFVRAVGDNDGTFGWSGWLRRLFGMKRRSR